eukprot:525564_1
MPELNIPLISKTSIAVVLAVAASVLWAIGNVVQKRGHNDTNSKNYQSSFLRDNTWKLGFLIYAIGSIIGGAALSFGSLAMIATLESTTLVFNAIFGSWYLSEKINKKDIDGMILILLGCVLCVCSGPEEPTDENGKPKEYTLDELTTMCIRNYYQTEFIVYIIIYSIVTLIILGVIKTIESKPSNKDSMQKIKQIVYRPVVLLICYIFVATYFVSWNNIFSKSFLGMVGKIRLSFFMDSFFLYSLIGFLLSNFGLECFRQRAMKYYGVVIVIPIYRVGSVISACMTAAFYFGEFKNFNSPHQIGMFAVAIALTLIGIIVLTSEKEHGPCGNWRGIKWAQEEIRDSVCNSVSISTSVV